MFDDYRKAVPETVAPFGGRFVARGGNLSVLEGEWPHSRLVIIEFPSRADAEGWYEFGRLIKRSSHCGTRVPLAMWSSLTERRELFPNSLPALPSAIAFTNPD